MESNSHDPGLALQFVETLLWITAGLVAGVCLIEVGCVLTLLAGGGSEGAHRPAPLTHPPR